MANNRMWLVNKTTKERVLLAKYYPSTGWCVFHNKENWLSEKLNALFDTDTLPSMWGKHEWELEYEMEEE